MATDIGKKLLDSFNNIKGGASNFLKANPTPAGFLANRINPAVVSPLATPQRPQQQFQPLPTKPLGILQNTFSAPNLRSYGQNLTQTFSGWQQNPVQRFTSAIDNIPQARKNFQSPLPQLTNPLFNTGQTVLSGMSDVVKGSQNLVKGRIPQGAAQVGFGVGKTLAPFSGPLFQTANVATQNAYDPVRRFAKGVLQGQTGIDEIAPDVQGKNVKVGPMEFDPLMAAGSMAGFVKNPTWNKIFPVTSKLLNLPINNPVTKFVVGRLSKGGLEGMIQGFAQLPQDAKPEDYWKVAESVLFGSASELASDTAMAGGKKVIGSLANTPQGKAIIKAVSEEWRKQSRPYATTQADPVTGKRIVVPLWQHTLFGGVNNKFASYIGINAEGFPKTGEGTFSSMADKKVRFEIDDSGAKLKNDFWSAIESSDRDTGAKQMELLRKNPGKSLSMLKAEGNKEAIRLVDNLNMPLRGFKLGEVLDHSELYKNYPDLKNINVRFLENEIEGGHFNPQTNTIQISQRGKNEKSTLLHEIQHAIQEKEGFAAGGSPESTRFPIDIQDNLKRLGTQIQEKLSKGEDVSDLMQKQQQMYEEGQFSAYLRLAGEVEARDVQSRMNLTPEQRATTLPYQSQGIPVKDQIVRFEGGTQASIDPQKVTGTQSPGQKLPVDQTKAQTNPLGGQTSEVLKQLGQESPSLTSSVDSPRNTSVKNLPESQLKTSQDSLNGSIAQKTEIPPQTLNVNNLNLTPEQKTNVIELDAKGVRDVLSNEEILRVAKKAGFDTKTYSTDQTAEMIAKQLNTRRQVVELENIRSQMIKNGASEEELINITRQAAQAAKATRMQGTQLGRELQARKIMANEINTPMQKVFQLLDTAGVNPETYEKAAAKVDFYNPQEAMKFYRQFAPAKTREWIDLVRYNSMLSSPNTWINNFFSNAVNTSVIAPIEKTLTGTLDFIAAPFRGGKRQAFALEGPVYAKGYFSNVGKAIHKFSDVMRGNKLSTNLDIREIPLAVEGKGAARYKALSVPTKILEGTDQFFQALTQGGETAALKYRSGKGVKVGDIQAQAEGNAAYRLFRSKLKDEKQGAVLNAVDELTATIEKARNSKSLLASTIAKFTLPFVRTPMNIFKQGIEYSPAGITTLIGAQNKTEQLSKAIMGTAGVAGTLALLESGRLTWSEPTDQKKKNAFRAAGMQPYGIKIGNQWYSYQKLPPALSYPLAFTAAVHDAYKNKLITDSQLDVIMNAVAKYGNFYADQSYVKSIGDAVASVKGDPEAMARQIGNYAQQLVPYRALFGWMARLTDPYQRKVNTDTGILEQQIQSLFTQLPFLSQTVPARTDAIGNPIPNQNRALNAFSPLKVTTENPDAKQYYDILQEKSLMNKNVQALKDQAAKETITTPQAKAAEDVGINPQDAMRAKAQEEITKTRVEISGQPQTTNNKYFYLNDNGNATSIDLKFSPKLPKATGIDVIDKQNISNFKSKITARIKDIGVLLDKEVISRENAVKELNDLMKLKGGGTGKKSISDAQLMSAYRDAIKAAYAPTKRSGSYSAPRLPTVSLKRQSIKSLR